MKIEGISRAIIVIIFINVNLLECQDVSVRVKQGTLVGVGWSFCGSDEMCGSEDDTVYMEINLKDIDLRIL